MSVSRNSVKGLCGLVTYLYRCTTEARPRCEPTELRRLLGQLAMPVRLILHRTESGATDPLSWDSPNVPMRMLAI